MTTVKVKGMSCQHCVQSVTKAVSAVAGVANVKVDLMAGTASYEETTPVDVAAVKAAIVKVGFEAG
ncbi:MAG: heavy-metal-associated domain-containing protein [Desulfovibrionaceae bacterium]